VRTLRPLLPAIALAAAVGSATPTAAERLITSLSNHRVMVTPSYAGEELVLFGAVERDAQTVPRRSGYDVVITVTGPRRTMVTWRKERVLGIWVNADPRVFENAPAYLAVLASRPLDQIATRDVLRRLQIGLDYFLLPQRIGGDTADVVANDPFRTAFLRLRIEQGLYREEPNAVTFLTPNLFRASIPLPAEVPVGTYEIDVKLFADGAMIARTASALEIIKVGFEQFVADAARQHGLLYGFTTAMMALFTGWFASVVFRRD
jgi:uncharacterized protein (TIGR02186 family)